MNIQRPKANLVHLACGLVSIITSSCGNDAALEVNKVEQAVEETASKPAQENSQQLHTRSLSAPAGNLPATRHVDIDGFDAAVLPNGRILTPIGVEVSVDAPKPYGLALSPDGSALATINSGSSRFSVTLVRGLDSASPEIARVDVDATFMGVTFSEDGHYFYASGGENGNLWVGDVDQNAIVGSVNLNGPEHPLDRPLAPNTAPSQRFKGAFPGNLTLSPDGRYLYAVDQAGFRLHVVDTHALTLGADADGNVIEPDNFQALVNAVDVGRYPYGLALSHDGRRMFVSNVGVFQYTHLMPESPTGDANLDYPLCYPAVGYPEETQDDVTLLIKKVDPRNLPVSLRDPDGIRCGYIDEDRSYTVPGLGSPNVPESSSVYVLNTSNPRRPRVIKRVKSGLLVGQKENGIAAYSGSHPNSVAIGQRAIYVANGNNDSITILNPHSYHKRSDFSLRTLSDVDERLKGVQPVALKLSPDGRRLYVAEAGLNAVAVLAVARSGDLRMLGHIPVGWWPSAIEISADGRTLYVANSRGRGSGPDNDFPPDDLGSPKYSTLGSVSIVPVPGRLQLWRLTRRVLLNNGLLATPQHGPDFKHTSKRAMQAIKHVVFINKENATHDLLLGDIVATRGGEAVDGEPRYSLGVEATPNHHELALSFALGDNFFLEPSVSSDGHRWLTGSYTTEFEDTHWPASYGGRRRDSGNDPNVFLNFPGRLGFTDANGSPDPHDYNQHGGIYSHLHRHGKSFVNFGNGYEFAIVDEAGDTEPTGIREHVNIPMEKIVRDNSDHLYPEYNTHIPDAPLAEDPTRFSRFGRFKQVFESKYIQGSKCLLPAYTDLYYPNDHGGGARNIHPEGPDWSFTRYVQDNDAALGLTVDLISHSPCWKDTLIVVVEDDTQNGLDHVDGHRSIFLAISPWVKREYVSRVHLNLGSIFKTVNEILGLPALNQYDAVATDLRDVFAEHPDFTPYDFVPIDYDEPNPVYTQLTSELDFSEPDLDEVAMRKAVLESEGLPRAE